jgi:hypothetical protein
MRHAAITQSLWLFWQSYAKHQPASMLRDAGPKSSQQQQQQQQRRFLAGF